MATGANADNDDPTVDIAGELVHETEKAYLFYDGDHQTWLPKSLCEWDEHESIMTMPEWLAMREGLI